MNYIDVRDRVTRQVPYEKLMDWLAENLGEALEEKTVDQEMKNYRFEIIGKDWKYVYHHTVIKPSDEMRHLYKMTGSTLVFATDSTSSDFVRANIYEGYFLEIPDDSIAVYVRLTLP